MGGVPPVPAHSQPPRRKLTVPALLLILGVGLVSIALIFFLTLAWFVAGLGVRALIGGAITLAVIATASVLRRRTLTMTAEGVAVIGVVLLFLDAWALRAFDLFGASGVRPGIYFGLGLFVIGALCRVWALASRLRAPDLAASLALPIGIGLLVAGISGLPSDQATLVGWLSASAGSIIYVLPQPFSRAHADNHPETIALAAIGTLSLPLTALWAVLIADTVGVAVLAAGGIALLGFAHAVALRRHRDSQLRVFSDSFGAVASVTAVAALGVLAWQLFRITDNDIFGSVVAPAVAMAMAVAADRLRERLPNPQALWASTWILAALTLVVVAGTWCVDGISVAASEWSLWRTALVLTPFDPVALGALAGAVIATGAAALAPTLQTWRNARDVSAGILLIVAAFSSGVPVLAVGVSLLVCVCALVLIVRFGCRPGLLAVAAIGAGCAYLLGFAVAGLWFAAVAAAIATPIVLYRALRPRYREVLSLLAAGVAAVSAVPAPAAIFAVTGDWRIGFSGSGSGLANAASTLAATQTLWRAIAIIVLVIVLALGSRLAPVTRNTLALSGLVLVALGLVPSDRGDEVFVILGGASAAAVTTGILAALCLVIAFARTHPTSTGVRVFSAVLAAPAALATSIWVGHAINSYEDGPAIAGAVLATAIAIGAAALTWRAAPPAAIRIGSDSGVVVALVAALSVRYAATESNWPTLAAAAVALGAMAVTRGFAATRAATRAGVITAPFDGMPTAQAIRRLLAWPSIAALTVAYYALLLREITWVTLITITVIPALLFAGFALALIWLRRWNEAAVATGCATFIYLVVGSFSFRNDLIGMVTVLIVAAVLAVVVTATPFSRVGGSAVVAASFALAGMAITTYGSIIAGPQDSAAQMWLQASRPWWIFALVAVGFAAAAAVTRRPDARASLVVFSQVAPAVALAVGAVLIASDHLFPDATTGTVTRVAAGIGFAIHVAAARVNRVPLHRVVRWTALAVVWAMAALAPQGFFTPALSTVEGDFIPVALTLLAGVVAAHVRLHRAGTAATTSGGETVPWLIGLALLLLPSVFSPYQDARGWVFVIGALAIGAITSLRVIPARLAGMSRWSALISAGSVVLMGVHAVLASHQAVAVVAGFGAIGIAALRVPRDVPAAGLSRHLIGGHTIASTVSGTTAQATTASGSAGETRVASAAWVPVLIAAVGVTEFFIYTLTVAGGELVRTLITLALGTAVGLVGAALLRRPQWLGFGLVIAIGGVVHAVSAAGFRVAATRFAASSSVEPDLWLLAGLVAVLAIGLVALWSHPSRLIGRGVGIAWSVAVLLWGLAEGSLLTGDSIDAVRAAVTMTGYAVIGTFSWVARGRAGILLPITSAAAAAVYAVVALAYQVSPVEVLTVPPALALLALGIRWMRREPQARSLPALGPGIALLTIPALLHDFTDTTLWRVVALGLVALALVVVGAVRRLQAPLVLGAPVLIVHAVAQLWPWITSVYANVPWWLWLGIAGAILIFLAARYERQLRAFRRAFVAITSLR